MITRFERAALVFLVTMLAFFYALMIRSHAAAYSAIMNGEWVLMENGTVVADDYKVAEADAEAQEQAAEAQKAQMQRTIAAERSKLTDNLQNAQAAHGDDVSSAEVKKKPVTNKDGSKVGRNDPCPCGSGKKYKNCCGKNA